MFCLSPPIKTKNDKEISHSIALIITPKKDKKLKAYILPLITGD